MRNKSNQTKYYRIIDDPIRYQSRSQPNPSEFKHLLAFLSTRNKYLYIDINANEGYKLMEKCQETEESEEMQRVGDSFISHLGNSSGNNRSSLSYLFKLQEINRQKETAFRLLSDQLQHSQLKLKKKKSSFLQEARVKQKEKKQIYQGMDAGLLEQYKYSSELDSIDQEIRERQNKLLENYSTLAPGSPTQKKLKGPKETLKKLDRSSLILLSD